MTSHRTPTSGEVLAVLMQDFGFRVDRQKQNMTYLIRLDDQGSLVASTWLPRQENRHIPSPELRAIAAEAGIGLEELWRFLG